MKLTSKLQSIKVNNNVCEYIGLLPSNLTRKAFSICLESPTISLSEIKRLVPTSSARNAISYCPEIMGLPKKYRAWAALQCKCNEIGEVLRVIKLHERNDWPEPTSPTYRSSITSTHYRARRYGV